MISSLLTRCAGDLKATQSAISPYPTLRGSAMSPICMKHDAFFHRLSLELDIYRAASWLPCQICPQPYAPACSFCLSHFPIEFDFDSRQLSWLQQFGSSRKRLFCWYGRAHESVWVICSSIVLLPLQALAGLSADVHCWGYICRSQKTQTTVCSSLCGV